MLTMHNTHHLKSL